MDSNCVMCFYKRPKALGVGCACLRNLKYVATFSLRCDFQIFVTFKLVNFHLMPSFANSRVARNRDDFHPSSLFQAVPLPHAYDPQIQFNGFLETLYLQ